MKSNVNPFEPWRPAENAVPRPLHAARPWRPPTSPLAAAAVEELPYVEPVSPRPRRNRPQRSRAEQLSPQHPPVPNWVIFVLLAGPITFFLGKIARGYDPQMPHLIAMGAGFGIIAMMVFNPPVPRTRNQRWAAFFLLVIWLVLSFSSVGFLRDTQAPRLFALAASSGILAALAFNPRRSWYKRLTGMAVVLTLAGLAAWFVPTLHGVNLWSAYRQVEALHALPAGDLAAYQRGAKARRLLVEEFPSFAADVRDAEQAWLRRTVDEAVEKADRQLEVDPHAAVAELHRLNAGLKPLESYATVRNELEAARRRALQACIHVAVK